MVYSSLFDDWFERAEEDKKLAYQAFSAGIYRGTCFHAQQSVEKLFKAILIKRDVFAPIHDLIKLAVLIENEYQVKVVGNIVSDRELEVLNIHYIFSRYAPPPRGTPERAKWENIIKKYGPPKYDKSVAEGVLRIMEKIWDGVGKLGLI